ncbi:unnamed protein product [Peniophora sp. CBMAI 1063]|nr:unnamed protein product [Peniophora sp. CBMAI 1063]
MNVDVDTDFLDLDLEHITLDEVEKLSERQITILLARKVKEYEAAERPLPFRFRGLMGQANPCDNCMEYIKPNKTPKLCSGCKAVTYCSRQCQVTAWKGYRMGMRPHKVLCDDNKRHMQRLPRVSAVLKQFPWGRVEENGTFNLKVAKARFGVYGSTGFGFWSHSIGENPHQDMRYTFFQRPGETFEDHDNGYDLLHLPFHLTDRQGWGLDEDLIPYRDLESISREKWPVLITEFAGGVKDWASWYRWRKLPLESPAALLMDYPLTTYHLLTHTLSLTSTTAGSATGRISLDVHMLGAEIELNFMPLYSELALLLPYHDITISVFGYGVYELARQATSLKALPHSPAGRAFASPDTPLFEYKALDELGGSTLKIFLRGESDVWSWEAVRKEQRPDALIAHDAGLCVYPGWAPVIKDAHRLRIPFAVTDYAEQSAEFEVRTSIPARLYPQVPVYGPNAIELNPFHKPGQRASRVRLPNIYTVHHHPVIHGDQIIRTFILALRPRLSLYTGDENYLQGLPRALN